MSRSTGHPDFDAVVIGAGHNGLAAAIELARTGRRVLLREANDTIGGSCRSGQLTLPGFVHDTCSTVMAFLPASPFFRSLPQLGVELIRPHAPVGHPFDDGSAALLEQSLHATASALGRDAEAWRRLFGPFIGPWHDLAADVLNPISLPRHPVRLARLGIKAIRSARALVDSHFRTDHARGLFAGIAAHSVLPLEKTASAAFGILLAVSAHVDGWPIVRGGSQKLVDALASHFRSLGGLIETGTRVDSLDELPAPLIFADITPRQLLRIAGHRLPDSYRKRLESYRYGPGAWKLDWALDGPIPWKATQLARCGTVHLGGSFEEIAHAEREMWEGRHPEQPYVLLAQQTLFDATRAPRGKHTAWAYTHVPNGSTFDMSDRIERQVERFAPGFRDRILARHVTTPADFEARNPNLVGGDFSGGAHIFSQLIGRPVVSVNPYKTALKGVYLCSSSTPPGGGIHGMCGRNAVRRAVGRGP